MFLHSRKFPLLEGTSFPTDDNNFMPTRDELIKVIRDVERKLTSSTKNFSLRQKLLGIASGYGSPIIEQASFHKISRGKKSVYISKNGSRIDVSGFEIHHPAVMFASERTLTHSGSVTCHIDMRATENDVVDAFVFAMEEMNAEK